MDLHKHLAPVIPNTVPTSWAMLDRRLGFVTEILQRYALLTSICSKPRTTLYGDSDAWFAKSTKKKIWFVIFHPPRTPSSMRRDHHTKRSDRDAGKEQRISPTLGDRLISNGAINVRFSRLTPRLTAACLGDAGSLVSHRRRHPSAVPASTAWGWRRPRHSEQKTPSPTRTAATPACRKRRSKVPVSGGAVG